LGFFYNGQKSTALSLYSPCRTLIRVLSSIGDAALNWAMRTAGRKWKEFKATIKGLYLNPEFTIDEVGECPDKRFSDADWKFLYNY
jgi:hypothetical protein